MIIKGKFYGKMRQLAVGTAAFAMLATAVAQDEQIQQPQDQVRSQAIVEVIEEKTIEIIEIEEMLISVGSRVSGRTATDAPVPVDIISAEDLARNASTELGQALQSTAPSFNFSRTQVSDGSDLFRPATLRGLQPDQTLVLINGKRRHNQSIFSLLGTVGEGAAGTDMNAIPMVALEAVEVLRDGAAAQYGSDAIAGVINLRLKESTDETSGFVQWGQTEEGDGDNLTFAINSGLDIGTDGFVNGSFEYRDADRTNRAKNPAWHQGDPDTEFQSVFVNALLPVDDTREFYAFGGISNRTALGSGFYREANKAEKNVKAVYKDGFLPNIDNEAEDVSIAVGYRQQLNDIWNMDASVVYGENSYDFHALNTLNASIAAEYVQDNPDATSEEIVANAGPTSGYSGGFGFDQTTFNLDFTGQLDIGANQPLYTAFGLEYRDENYQMREGDLLSYSCGETDDLKAIPSVDDPENKNAICGFQGYPGVRDSSATGRDNYAAYIDLEHNIIEPWLVGAAVRYEDYGDTGRDLTGKLSTRFDVTEDFALRGAVATGFRAPSLQQSGYTAYTGNINDDGELELSYTAATGSAIPVALGVDTLELETSASLSLGVVWNPADSVTITLDGYQVEIEDRITLGDWIDSDDVDDNVLQDRVTKELDNLGVTQANFFSNAVDTTTRGIDAIITYDTELADGDLDITLAANINSTSVDSINAPDGVAESLAFSTNSESFMEGGQPGERSTLSFDWARDNVFALLRLNYYGETEVDYFGRNHVDIPDTLPTSVVESAVLVDINIAYDLNDRVRLSVGGNNIFDATPDELDPDNEVLSAISGDAFRYPLRAVSYGFNGASYYLKMNYSF